MTKHLIRIITAVMTTLLALLVLWQFRVVVIYVLISLILAAVMRPLANQLHGKRLTAHIVWILLFLVALGSLGFLLFIIGKYAGSEIQILAQSVAAQDVWTLPVWLEGSAIQQTLEARMPPPSELLNAFTGEQGQLMFPALFGFVKGVGGIVAAGFVILFLSIYWSINQIHFERLWLSLLPSEQRKQARSIWRAIELDLGGYIRGQLMQSLLGGLLLGTGYWLLGSSYPVTLALFGALAFLIPVVGAALAVIPPLLVGLLTSVQISLFTVLFTLIVLIVILIWIKPHLFKRRWDNPILTVVLLIALADAFGIVGIFIAPPISAVFQILWERLVSHRVAAGASAQISDLKERLSLLKETVSAMEEPHPPLVTNSMERITNLILEAEPYLPSESIEDIPDMIENAG